MSAPTTTNPVSSSPKRSWRRFTLRALFLVVLAASGEKGDKSIISDSWACRVIWERVRLGGTDNRRACQWCEPYISVKNISVKTISCRKHDALLIRTSSLADLRSSAFICG
jgi:hypothetical protein